MSKLIPFLFLILIPTPLLASAEPELCADPRPQVCTQEYAPVCATLADGSNKTYSNGCMACGDANVGSWVDGACES